ncbi:GNAT family N-acetyltransferase [Mesorhizobium sp. M1227]|uniref:GNAT family N-acetyltransferase n=1 Tax=Mesorhizobium sp. M1227 TaxID=2957071 RepID=UPI00333BAE65
MKLLIDTNVIIQLEDSKEIKAQFADLQRKCQEHGISVFVHEASLEDIERDPDKDRRKITLSKVKKFRQLKGVHVPPEEELAKLYGKLPKPNDVCDAKMLHAVADGVVELFVTEDDGIHRRAKAAGLSEQVLTVADAVAWLKQAYEPDQVFLPSVEYVKAYNIDFKDEIFDDLAADYVGFREVWVPKCKEEHRDCWVIKNGGKLAAIVIRKDETHAEAGTHYAAAKILKICTFKVAQGYRGQKLGEQLLKQVLWHCQRNGYDLTYVTAFPKQEALIRLLEEYGFEKTKTLAKDELVYEKPMGSGPLSAGTDKLRTVKKNYPRFSDDASVGKFVVPIQPGYHRKLFPEVTAPTTGSSGVPGGKPGNTIKKVYICHAPTNALQPGDLLFFYMTKSPSYGSQSMTSVGIVESVRWTLDVNEVRKWTAKRSVFSDTELAHWVAGSRPLKVIDFLLIGHLEPTVPLIDLLGYGVLPSWPQSINKIPQSAYAKLKTLLKLGFKF